MFFLLLKAIRVKPNNLHINWSTRSKKSCTQTSSDWEDSPDCLLTCKYFPEAWQETKQITEHLKFCTQLPFGITPPKHLLSTWQEHKVSCCMGLTQSATSSRTKPSCAWRRARSSCCHAWTKHPGTFWTPVTQKLAAHKYVFLPTSKLKKTPKQFPLMFVCVLGIEGSPGENSNGRWRIVPEQT